MGSAWSLASRITPLTQPPGMALRRALTVLDEGEEWLLEPRPAAEGGALWSPGIKLGVRPGSFFHRTECFGPVLGLMRADDLDEAIALTNATPFGLTAGIQTLDDREVARWVDRVEAGNLYVNRPITGAIVGRQPFGGWKASSVGPGAKAGGPNYVLTLGRWSDSGAAAGEPAPFDLGDHDATGLRAESNVLRHVPLPRGVLLRAGDDVTDEAIATAAAMAARAGTRLLVSSPVSRERAPLPVTVETDAELADRLAGIDIDRLRVPGKVPDELRAAAHAAEVLLDDAPVVRHPRIELLHHTREQSVTRTLHPYGNIPGS
jgi:RHH-type proline utilization regulon transcriptional repressor/proline dehydrogenase/delta 1-pyrroline-5-carboxylate dehydrogenase